MDGRSMSVVVVRIWEFHICTSLCTVIKQGKYSCCKNVFNKMRVKTFSQHYTFFWWFFRALCSLHFFSWLFRALCSSHPPSSGFVFKRKFAYHLILAFVMRGVCGGLNSTCQCKHFIINHWHIFFIFICLFYYCRKCNSGKFCVYYN